MTVASVKFGLSSSGISGRCKLQLSQILAFTLGFIACKIFYLFIGLTWLSRKFSFVISIHFPSKILLIVCGLKKDDAYGESQQGELIILCYMLYRRISILTFFYLGTFRNGKRDCIFIFNPVCSFISTPHGQRSPFGLANCHSCAICSSVLCQLR